MWTFRVCLADLLQQEVKFTLQVTSVKIKNRTYAPRQLVFGNEDQAEGSLVHGELSCWTSCHEDEWKA